MLLLSKYMMLHIVASSTKPSSGSTNCRQKCDPVQCKYCTQMRSQIYKQVDKMEAEIGKII